MLEVVVGTGEEDLKREYGIREGEVIEDLGAGGVEFRVVFVASFEIGEEISELEGVEFFEGLAEIPGAVEGVIEVDEIEKVAGVLGRRGGCFCDSASGRDTG